MFPLIVRLRSIVAHIVLCAAGFVCCGVSLAQSFSIEQRWVIGGKGSWDYLTADAATSRLYVSHETEVDVVDLSTGHVVGKIQGLKRCHTIVIPPGSENGFVSDGGGNRVVVFRLEDLKTIASIPAGMNPDGAVYEPVTKTIWAFNGGSKTATVIDVNALKVVATVPLPDKPEFPVTDGHGQIFVNLEPSSSVLHIDAQTHELVDTWKLKSCEGPSGLAIDTSDKRLFSVCDGHMAISDYTDGKQIGNAKIGDGADAVAFDFDEQLAFAPNEDGTLSIVDTAAPGYPVRQTLPTMNGARTLAFNPVSDLLYIVSAKLGPPSPPTPGSRHNRPPALPGTFTVLVVGHH
jgi:DNA-binding beta-propeller fold protein YncE